MLCSRPSWFHYVPRGRCWGKIAVGGGESRPPPPQWIDTVVVSARSRRSLWGETGNHLTKSATAWIVTFEQHDVSRLFDRNNLERIRLSYSQICYLDISLLQKVLLVQVKPLRPLQHLRGTQREYSSKPLKHSIVKLILVFKQ